jgi:hypothetical protein
VTPHDRAKELIARVRELQAMRLRVAVHARTSLEVRRAFEAHCPEGAPLELVERIAAMAQAGLLRGLQ